MPKKALRAAGIAAAAVTAAGAALGAYSHLRYGRSASATLCELAMRPISRSSTPRNSQELTDQLNKLSISNERPYNPPIPLRSISFDETRDDMKTYHIGTTGKNERAVLYLHGGGYAKQPNALHWSFVDRLCRLSGAEICVPLYPLAPEHSYDEAYECVRALYAGMVDRYGAENLTLMGDSAGGGFAAGLAEALPEFQLPQPAHLVLISPELDLSMFNPEIIRLAAKDPYLDPWAVAQYGRAWADGDDLTSPRLSPKFGDVSCLQNVTLYAGTRELYYPDIVEFADQLQAADVATDMVIGKNLNHAWPLHPTPEARRAMKDLAELVKSEA